MSIITAIKLLVALAYCHCESLLCDDCPLYNEESHKCLGYSEEDMITAAKIMKGEMKSHAEAVKEFARKLKCGVPQETGVIRCNDIANTLKEMGIDKQ